MIRANPARRIGQHTSICTDEIEELPEDVINALSDSSDIDWNLRANALQQLTNFSRDIRTAQSFDRKRISDQLRGLSRGLTLCISDLRSTLVKQACDTLIYLAETFGSTLTHAVGDHVIPALLKRSATTIRVIRVSSVDAAVSMLIHGSSGVSVRAAQHILDVLQDNKTPTNVRVAAAEYLGKLLGPPLSPSVVQLASDVDNAILSGCVDADNQVRKVSRANVHLIERADPVRGSLLIEQLPRQVTKLLRHETQEDVELEQHIQNHYPMSPTQSPELRLPARMSMARRANSNAVQFPRRLEESSGESNPNPTAAKRSVFPAPARRVVPSALPPSRPKPVGGQVHGKPNRVGSNGSPSSGSDRSGNVKEDSPEVKAPEDGVLKLGPQYKQRAPIATGPLNAAISHPFASTESHPRPIPVKRCNPAPRPPHSRSYSFMPQNSLEAQQSTNQPLAVPQNSAKPPPLYRKSIANLRPPRRSVLPKASLNQANSLFSISANTFAESDMGATIGSVSSAKPAVIRKAMSPKELFGIDTSVKSGIVRSKSDSSLRSTTQKSSQSPVSTTPPHLGYSDKLEGISPSYTISTEESKTPSDVLSPKLPNHEETFQSSSPAESVQSRNSIVEDSSPVFDDDEVTKPEHITPKQLSLQDSPASKYSTSCTVSSNKTNDSSKAITADTSSPSVSPSPRRGRISYILGTNATPRRPPTMQTSAKKPAQNVAVKSAEIHFPSSDLPRSIPQSRLSFILGANVTPKPLSLKQGSPLTQRSLSTPSQAGDSNEAVEPKSIEKKAKQANTTECPVLSQSSTLTSTSSTGIAKTLGAPPKLIRKPSPRLARARLSEAPRRIPSKAVGQVSGPRSPHAGEDKENETQALGSRIIYRKRSVPGLVGPRTFGRTLNGGAAIRNEQNKQTPPSKSAMSDGQGKGTEVLQEAMKAAASERSKSWQDRLDCAKALMSACSNLPKEAELDGITAEKLIGILGIYVGDAHAKVIAHALDAIFHLFLKAKSPQVLQGALERRPQLLRGVLARVGDKRDMIRQAADRVMQAFAVQFGAEVQVLLLVRAHDKGSPRLTSTCSAVTDILRRSPDIRCNMRTLDGLVELVAEGCAHRLAASRIAAQTLGTEMRQKFEDDVRKACQRRRVNVAVFA